MTGSDRSPLGERWEQLDWVGKAATIILALFGLLWLVLANVAS